MHNKSPRPTQTLSPSACEFLDELLTDKSPRKRSAFPEQAIATRNIEVAAAISSARAEDKMEQIRLKLSHLSTLDEIHSYARAAVAEVIRRA